MLSIKHSISQYTDVSTYISLCNFAVASVIYKMLDTEATPTKLSQTRNVSVTILPNFSLTFSLNFPLNFLSKAVSAFLYSGSRRARSLPVVK